MPEAIIKVGMNHAAVRTGAQEVKAQLDSLKRESVKAAPGAGAKEDGAAKKLEAQAADIRKRAALSALSDAERLNALEVERLQITLQIGAAESRIAKAALDVKRAQVETQMGALRKKMETESAAAANAALAKEAEAAGLRARAGDIRRKNDLAALTDAKKLVVLEQERLAVTRQIAAAKDAGTRASLDVRRAELEGDIAGLRRGRADKTKGTLKMAGGLALGAAAFGVAEIFGEAGKLQDTSEKYGIGSESLQRIGNVAKQNGADLETVGASLNKLVLSQEKARAGSEEHRKALADLGIDAAAFINLSPEEAFYKMSDALAESDDRGKAYAAVQALMGKKSQDLFTTMEMGGASIRQVGDDIGVWSAKTNAHLDEVGDKFAAIFNKIKVAMAEVLSDTIKGVQAMGAYAAKAWGWLNGDKSLMQGADAELEKIRNPPEREQKKRPQRDLEETQNAAAERERHEERVAALKEKLAEQAAKAQTAELEGEVKINDLIAQREKLLTAAADAGDEEQALTAQLKAGEVAKEIHAARERADKEAEAAAEKLAGKKAALEEKQFKNSLDGMSPEQKRAALGARRDALQEKLDALPDGSEQAVDLQSQIEDLSHDIHSVKDKDGKEARGREVVASDLSRKGLGGAAYFAPDTDPSKRAAKAAEKTEANTGQALERLERIETALKEGRWGR